MAPAPGEPRAGVRAFRLLGLAVLAWAAAGPVLRPAAAQGIGFEAAPVAAHLRWSEALGFGDDYLLGGRLGVRFGGLAELQGYYLTRSGLQLDPAALPPVPGFAAPPASREMEVRAFGADLVVDLGVLGAGSVAPFLRAGGGVLRLDPQDVEPTAQILLKAGGGLRLRLAGRVGAELFAEDWAFRLNRYRLHVPASPVEDPDANKLRHNLALGAALNLPLGGDPAAPAAGLVGTAFVLEPFAARLRFADELVLARQNLLGLRAGLDFHRLIGVRGFYWRGMNDDFDDTEPIQGYGGEVQFNLGRGPGLIPFLLAGAGQLDFRAGYRDEAGAPRDSRTALIFGGGLGISLSERVRVNLTIRDYILSDEKLDDVRRTDQLFHSPVLSAGLGFAVGGSLAPSLARAEREAQAEVERLRAEHERIRQEQEERAARLRAENERLRRAASLRHEPLEQRVIAVDPVTGDTVVQQVRVVEAHEARTLALPIPERGEIVIRFGEPTGAGTPAELRPRALQPVGPAASPGVAGLTAAELRELIRDVVRDEVQRDAPAAMRPAVPPAAAPPPAPAAAAVPSPAPGLSPAELREIVRETVRAELSPDPRTPAGTATRADALADERRLELLERRLSQRLEETLARRQLEQERWIARMAEPRPPTTVVVPLEPRLEEARPWRDTLGLPVPPPGDTLPIRRRFEPRYTRPYLGANTGGPAQFAFGGRVDFGAVRDGVPVNLVPEAALGFGSELSSFLLAANLQYDFRAPVGDRRVAPYVLTGLGIWHAGVPKLTANFGYGVSVLAGFTEHGPIRVSLEHHGIALYNRHRLLLGAQIPF